MAMPSLAGTLVLDERGEVRMCSDSLARLLGRPAASVVGRPVWTLLPGWDPFLHLPGGALFVIEVFLL